MGDVVERQRSIGWVVVADRGARGARRARVRRRDMVCYFGLCWVLGNW